MNDATTERDAGPASILRRGAAVWPGLCLGFFAGWFSKAYFTSGLSNPLEVVVAFVICIVVGAIPGALVEAVVRLRIARHQMHDSEKWRQGL